MTRAFFEPDLFFVALTVCFAAGLVIGARRLALRPLSRERLEQIRRRGFYGACLAACAFLVVAVLPGPLSAGQRIMFSILAGLMLAVSAWESFRRLTPAEELTIFGADPGRCARCGYDLTGNVSRLCPECGWSIPASSEVGDWPLWTLWWREWRIRRLRDWRRTFRLTLWIMLMFAGTAVIVLSIPWAIGRRPAAAFALPMVLMAAHFAVNAFRVRAYGRREARRRP